MTQQEAIDVMMSGVNVFLTGEPGAGKTYTLNKFIEQARKADKRIAITASTGIAASHIDGMTIHSWSGLGIADKIHDGDLERMSYKPQIRDKYNRCDILIIDEISMLHGSRLDMVDRACRWVRNNFDKPFGGLQVIFVGDMFQLPPVTRGSTKADYAHQSAAWAEANLQTCYLTEQHRQGADDELLDILTAMRQDRITGNHRVMLEGRQTQPDDPDSITRLYTHNYDVDAENYERLMKLPGKSEVFDMEDKGDDYRVQAMKRNLLCPERLELKIDAEVMFVANDFEVGFVNGTRGRVVSFSDGYPVVLTTDGQRIRVEEHVWRAFDSQGRHVVAEVSQIPLRLAWAVTIHKSQGMSLDSALVDLSNAFVPGMGYVALSRVRSLEGLYLMGLGPQALNMDPEIYKFDKQLRGGK